MIIKSFYKEWIVGQIRKNQFRIASDVRRWKRRNEEIAIERPSRTNHHYITTVVLCQHIFCNRKSPVDTGSTEKCPSWKAKIFSFCNHRITLSDDVSFWIFRSFLLSFLLAIHFCQPIMSIEHIMYMDMWYVYRHLKTIYDVCFLSVSLVIDNFKMHPKKYHRKWRKNDFESKEKKKKMPNFRLSWLLFL